MNQRPIITESLVCWYGLRALVGIRTQRVVLCLVHLFSSTRIRSTKCAIRIEYFGMYVIHDIRDANSISEHLIYRNQVLHGPPDGTITYISLIPAFIGSA